MRTAFQASTPASLPNPAAVAHKQKKQQLV
jgi:hypothetical protein